MGLCTSKVESKYKGYTNKDAQWLTEKFERRKQATNRIVSLILLEYGRRQEGFISMMLSDKCVVIDSRSLKFPVKCIGTWTYQGYIIAEHIPNDYSHGSIVARRYLYGSTEKRNNIVRFDIDALHACDFGLLVGSDK